MNRTFQLVAIPLALALGATGCKTVTPPASTAKEAATKPTSKFMPTAARAEATKSAAAHPTFKLFAQKPDLPTILVVAEDTSDDQLRNLLWYLREEVQSAHFKQLNLNPTASTYGGPSYLSGNLTIYRTPKCAQEMYLATTGKPGPCGDTTSHNAAAYHWGDDGNPAHDEADLFDATRKVATVFEATDGFQTDAVATEDPTGTKAQATEARIHYATTQTAKQSKQHTDIRFFVYQPADQLNAVSYQFASGEARQRFTREFITLESDHLCALGFHNLALGTKITDTKPTPIPCPTESSK